MKHKLPVMLAACLWAGLPAAGGTEASAVVAVRCTVEPALAVAPREAVVDAGTVTCGEFSATIRFQVRANRPAVSMFVQASPMYKGDDPDSSDAKPIPLKTDPGVTVRTGQSGTATFTGPGQTVDGFPTLRTEPLRFESTSQAGFSQDVHVTVTWNQDDPGRPRGQYGGRVKLRVMLLP